MDKDTVLEAEHLCTHLVLPEGTSRVVDDVSFSIKQGETLALVGESGCGKTMTAYSVMRLVPSPPGRIVSGRILFQGTDILGLSEKEMRSLRGNDIAMIFQEPLTALNPVFTIGDQIIEPLRIHRSMNKKIAFERAEKLLSDVGIPPSRSVMKQYPHQLSGGMRQRVMIAMALTCEPRLIIADEPTTALDVTVQAQIMELIVAMKKKNETALLLITHDLGVVAETAQKVAVMYAGQIVEYTDVQTIFRNPLNPYTRGLMQSLPRISGERLQPIGGMVPALNDLPAGCAFSTRCPLVHDRCRESAPLLEQVSDSRTSRHLVRCWLYA